MEPPVWDFGDLRIRRYRGADLDTVLALHRAGLAQVGLRPGDGVYYDHDIFRMEEIYLRAGGEFLVGELLAGRGEPDVVAMGGLRPAELVPSGPSRALGGAYALRPVPEPEIGEMVRLRVRPDMQRRGYGRALAQVLEERARELGYRLMRADTTDRQEAALALYRGLGWRETAREVISGIVNVYIEKRIGPRGGAPSPPGEVRQGSPG